ncbi:MAG: SCP2 sterol-binding domain-containing protein [Oscillospiraceae bacterium]|nr:SCP2 sterol-binding domain-containing protein [Oscillospiraceae bacterium]
MAEEKKIIKSEGTAKPKISASKAEKKAPAAKAVAVLADAASKKTFARKEQKKVEVKSAAVKKQALKKAASKAVVKEPSAKKTIAAKTVKATAKAVGKRGAAVLKAVPVRGGRRKAEVVIDSTDKIKTALWKSINKAKAKKVSGEVAIQVYAEGLDSFYIAVKNGEPEIERYFYNNNNGSLNISEKELTKLALGKYDVIAAVKSGAVSFDGNLSIFLKIMDLFS